MAVDEVVAALADEHEDLRALLVTLDPADLRLPTRCRGWDVGDVVLHLAQTDAMAIDSLSGRLPPAPGSWAETGPPGSVDEGAAAMVAAERGADPGSVVARWSQAAAALDAALGAMDLSTRVPWVAGELSARTLATTRLAETWIHGGDVAEALGLAQAPSPRLRLVARLAWRTLPHAFARAGRVPAGPVAFHLTAPDGGQWDFVPDDEPRTVVRGPALDLCQVAARRLPAASTALVAEGPDAAEVLELVRTYA